MPFVSERQPIVTMVFNQYVYVGSVVSEVVTVFVALW